MRHILQGFGTDTAHHHDTTAEARECEADSQEVRLEMEAEGAWLRVAEQGSYAGSFEEAQDRYLDSLAGR